MKYIFLIIGVLLLGGCTTVLYKDGATQADYQSDFGQCDYEVSLHANGVDNSYRTMIGQEFDVALRKKELMLKCMRNKGWAPKK
jgi:uncharacterized protein YceK